VKDIWA